MSEDIQCAGSDTRPPMLDRTDFESWQQRIRLYCLGKDNGENIMKSITEGPFQMGTMTMIYLTEGGKHDGSNAIMETDNDGKEQSYGSRRQSCGSEWSLEDITIANNHGRPFRETMQEEMLLWEVGGEQVTTLTMMWMDDSTRMILALQCGIHIYEDDQCEHSTLALMRLPNVQTYNEENGVQSNVSSVQNDALMSIINEMHEEGVQQGVQSRLANKPDKVVNDSLTSELARYKELVGVRKETSLKSELHSAQLQLRSTLNHHKIVREEAIILKKDFKQKEDKFLEEFLDIKRIKEKVEDRLYKQDQSVQTVHMLCKPKLFYAEKNKIEDLKAQLEGNLKVATRSSVKPKVLAPGMYAIDVKPIPHPLKNNRSAHLTYINHLKESVETVWGDWEAESGGNPKGKLSENSLNKTKQVWKATGKLFANVGYQWRSTGKKVALGKPNYGYQWRPTGKKFSLGELCPLTRLSVVQVILSYLDSGFFFVQTYVGESFKLKKLCGEYVHTDSPSQIQRNDHFGAIIDLLKGSRSTNLYTISIDDMMKSFQYAFVKDSKSKSWLSGIVVLNHLNFGTVNDLARNSGPNGNNNNRGNSGQNAGTCYECGVQGHF
ncbi:hypothetical protein Tco_0591132 [Tanacetum coccineum]